MDARQCTAILHLATGASNKQAAEAVGVSLSALEKWKQKADFQESLKEAIQQIYTNAVAELAIGATQAAKELRRIATDPESSDRVKVSAITTLFSQLEKFKAWEVEQRLAKVEEVLNGDRFEQN